MKILPNEEAAFLMTIYLADTDTSILGKSLKHLASNVLDEILKMNKKLILSLDLPSIVLHQSLIKHSCENFDLPIFEDLYLCLESKKKQSPRLEFLSKLQNIL